MMISMDALRRVADRKSTVEFRIIIIRFEIMMQILLFLCENHANAFGKLDSL